MQSHNIIVRVIAFTHLRLMVVPGVFEVVVGAQGAWEELAEDSEMADDYGLGTRASLEEAVEAVLATLGMAPCEGTDVVPPNAR